MLATSASEVAVAGRARERRGKGCVHRSRKRNRPRGASEEGELGDTLSCINGQHVCVCVCVCVCVGVFGGGG
jgi:hypothetical protein